MVIWEVKKGRVKETPMPLGLLLVVGECPPKFHLAVLLGVGEILLIVSRHIFKGKAGLLTDIVQHALSHPTDFSGLVVLVL